MAKCFEYKEVNPIRNLMFISFCFFRVDQDNERRYLQHELCRHPVWQLRDFWETTIIESIYEAVSPCDNANANSLM